MSNSESHTSKFNLCMGVIFMKKQANGPYIKPNKIYWEMTQRREYSKYEISTEYFGAKP